MPVVWLFSIEAGTSRTASRSAASSATTSETVVDTATGRWFDRAAAVALLGAVVAPFAAPGSTIRARRSSFVVGVVCLCGAGILSRAARRHLGRFHRDALTVHADHQLVDTGPYRVVRHPLYVATVGALLGIAGVLGTWIGVAFVALPTAAIVRRIEVEERMLLEELGSSYVRYRTRTSRLLPGVW